MTTQAPPRLPRYQGGDPATRLAWDQLCYALETWMQAVTVPTPRYQITNIPPDRVLDGSAYSGNPALQEVGQTLGTLIIDLQRKGIVG